ncbi:protein-L-isoaspartate(D-aspartate) O-methyltransferase [Streptomyces rectiverticillatus]|uniref:protein-L-isoaspartate(D-aspartate) O-methyltransferase n=1 Tax=Streptomyces rectiverticillatus TaxID=173860 RepID=UPI0015C3ACF4|nr:protein-L-isoaspartate(D-aspartate) O-methyltransferase [Streptomyces rectiverticillatus]QLE74657.1 protein-L-isoaspartate(D-aspartate) O-methyltransferase [Streptomyces rectiverticillatus]
MTARKEEVGPSGLASALVASGALQSDWLPTFKAVPRDLFVPDRIWPGIADGTRQNPVVDRAKDPDAWFRAVYSDIPLTTQWDDGNHTGDGLGKTPSSSSSQPHMVFSMLADLDVKDGHRVLEIGTGTGWNSALLAHRLGGEIVVSIEYDPEVARGAGENQRNAGLSPLVIVRDGRLGYAGGAPYDRIIATCSVGEVPRAWVDQTLTGGLIVAPWGTLYGGEAIVRLTVDDGTASGRFTRSSAFMRLRQQRPNLPPHDAYLKGHAWPGDGVRSTTTLSPAEVGGWVEQFAIGLQMSGAFWSVERYDDGSYTLWTYSTDTLSWASADYEPGADSFEVVQSGPRRLWDETEAAYCWWEAQGRPGFDRFGLTVAEGAERPWLDSPDHPVPAVG